VSVPARGHTLGLPPSRSVSLISQLEISATIIVRDRHWGTIMQKLFCAAIAAASLAFASTATTPVYAGDGNVAAGVIGGLAAGTIIGAAVAGPHYYAPPPPVYVAPAPYCYWTRGEPVWDGYRGVWTYPPIRVCE
jgi:hypothetical protein